MIRVWHYQEIRASVLFLAALAAMSGALLVFTSREAAAGLLLLLAAFQVFLYVNGLDQRLAEADARPFARRLLTSLGGAALVSGLAYYVRPQLSPGPGQAIRLLALAVLIVLLSRWLLRLLVKRNRMVESLLIVGTGDMGRKFYAELQQARQGRPQAADGNSQSAAAAAAEAGFLLYSSELREWVHSHGVTRVVVAEPDAIRAAELAEALLDCKLRGVVVEQAVDSYERRSRKIWLDALEAPWMIYSQGFRPPAMYRYIKGAADRLGALLLLALTWPALLAIALAVKLESRGPVLFRQLRTGQHGKNFVLYKFRSMGADAESGEGPKWAAQADSRVTAIGRWLRKFRLDELPQAFNVLRGDMSLVGPRPERPYFVNMLRQRIPFYDLRLYVKPGITGWAQVYYPYGASVEDAYEKLQYDLYYTKHVSLMLDLRILLSTLRVVFFGRGR
ncbi:MAG: TIGR03013 family PEP-CTERM/XrtA system glycosyltransferase [Acidobacteria bacterium]|jgi:sugar transferase (PEP-CTERM system associated)|nr:TIGR03013 family PEP-CTERM/XrtA system glycosyltransferase [Acidobacteriota bacterium]